MVSKDLENQKSGYSITNIAPTNQSEPYTTGDKVDSTIDVIHQKGQDINNVLEAIDRALNPEKYATVQPQPAQPQKAGIGWGTILLISAALGTGGYIAYNHFNQKTR